jgi:hypothetical protein
MVIIGNLGGADISPGDFVLANRGNSRCVCCIKRVIPSQSFEVVWWSEVSEGAPMCPNTFPNLLQSKIIEISADDSTSVICCSDINDVAFVFSAEIIEQWWADVSGMSRVFFTRDRDHVPFNPNVIESYPSRVWHSLLSIKELVRKLLSKKRQMHVCRSSSTTTLPLEGWRYISLFFSPLYFQKNQTKVFQFPDLSLQSKSSVKLCGIIRIASLVQMETARQLFGRTFGIGTRNIPPRKGLPRKVMEVGNIVNVVDVSGMDMQGKFKEFTAEQRIDLVYEEASRMLSVRVVYRDVKAEHELVSRILKFPTLAVTPENNVVPPARVRRVRAVPPETLFVYNGRYFQVTHSDARTAFATCQEDGELLRLSNEELWDLMF